MIKEIRSEAPLRTREGSTPQREVDRKYTSYKLWPIAVLFLAGMGCATPSLSDLVVGSSFVPRNVLRSSLLPPDVRRIAILPMTTIQATAKSDAGLELLYPVLLDAIIKTKKFEVIAVTSEHLRQWTGKFTWNAEDNLPPNFFQLLKTELGCDAVLFSRLNVFHPYPPLAVGWNLKLVRVDEPKLLWAADENLDAAEQCVVNGARRYQQAEERLSRPLADSRSILVSPRRFGQYAANTILATLPER